MYVWYLKTLAINAVFVLSKGIMRIHEAEGKNTLNQDLHPVMKIKAFLFFFFEIRCLADLLLYLNLFSGCSNIKIPNSSSDKRYFMF